jgi:hypothetical protein
MQWHHRTIKHIDSTDKDDEPYLTVHEFFAEMKDGATVYTGFSTEPASPRTLYEAKWIVDAFNHPPAVEIDDSTMRTDEMGFPDYDYRWLISNHE